MALFLVHIFASEATERSWGLVFAILCVSIMVIYNLGNTEHYTHTTSLCLVAAMQLYYTSRETP